VDPLRIFVYNEGLARFATNKYVEPTPGNANDLYMHLTNYSVNKRNSHYELCDNDDCGSKRKLSAINNWMRRHNYDVEEFWSNVDDVIIKTVLSAWPVLKHNYHACFPGHDKIQACFEILGFDILVDLKKKASAGKETDEISPYYGQSSGQNSPVPGAEAKLQGFIQLNNTTYRVECPTRLVNPPKNLDEERAARLSLLSIFL